MTKSFSLKRLRELHAAIAVTAKTNAENRNPDLGLETLVAADSAVREFEKYAAQHILALADRLQAADTLLATMGAGNGSPPEGMHWKDVLRIIREAKDRHASRPREQREG